MHLSNRVKLSVISAIPRACQGGGHQFKYVYFGRHSLKSLGTPRLDHSFPLLHHPPLFFCFIKNRLLEVFPGHLLVHALVFVQGKDLGRAVNVFSHYTREACVHMRTVWALLQWLVAETAHTPCGACGFLGV